MQGASLLEMRADRAHAGTVPAAAGAGEIPAESRRVVVKMPWRRYGKCIELEGRAVVETNLMGNENDYRKVAERMCHAHWTQCGRRHNGGATRSAHPGQGGLERGRPKKRRPNEGRLKKVRSKRRRLKKESLRGYNSGSAEAVKHGQCVRHGRKGVTRRNPAAKGTWRVALDGAEAPKEPVLSAEVQGLARSRARRPGSPVIKDGRWRGWPAERVKVERVEVERDVVKGSEAELGASSTPRRRTPLTMTRQRSRTSGKRVRKSSTKEDQRKGVRESRKKTVERKGVAR